jgi:hypothetical protein
MKRLVVVALLALELAISGCGSSTTNTAPTTASGTWQAVLSGGTGEASALSFVTTFTVNSDGSLNVHTVEFITGGPTSCFVSAASATGSLNVTTNADNVVTGPLSFTVQSGTPAGNTLTLAGTENGPTITGNWTLTGGTGCTGSGEFIMCEGTGPCTVTTTSEEPAEAPKTPQAKSQR